MDSTAIIRYLNDAFRTAMCGNGEVCWTPGIVALFGSPDPSDERVTTRVLTVMLAEEY